MHNANNYRQKKTIGHEMYQFIFEFWFYFLKKTFILRTLKQTNSYYLE